MAGCVLCCGSILLLHGSAVPAVYASAPRPKLALFRNLRTSGPYRQIEANRRNALKSTGPKTEAGKQASRCNALRHGLTAETVIGALEDAEDYEAFEAAITADYDAQSAGERELVLLRE